MRMPAVVGICLMVPSQLCASADPNVVDFRAVYARAWQHLKQGRCEESRKTIATVEGAVRANVDRDPGRAINILMVKARSYSAQLDEAGLERFLDQFEKEYSATPTASWVRRAAWYERVLCYRDTENLLQAVRALGRCRELEGQRVAGQDKANEFEGVMRDFDRHVKMPTEIGDLYRYMGKMELALEKYRPALEYVTAHFERMRPWDEHLRKELSRPLSPSKYLKGILPTVIRECEAPPDSPLGLLGRQVADEVEQAEWLLGAGRVYRQQRLLCSALEHYQRAQQALEAHPHAIDSLDRYDQARFLEIQQKALKGLSACRLDLFVLGDDPSK